ncbi:MAG: GGDEF domain-containing protein [Alphaproteobacteria bacterium]|nr:GGDEF domain-containing protein [Alphaproteobacteria bacterium]
MAYHESLELAAKYAKAALVKMATLGIVAQPKNFELWYGYYSGTNPELKQTLEVILRKKETFTDELNAELHDRFFGLANDVAEIQKASDRIQSAVTRVLEYLGDTNTQVSDYGKTLETMSGKIAKETDIEAIRSTVAGILSETKRMAMRSSKLEGQLKIATDEIVELHEHIQYVRQEAATDVLTGLPNRKHFDEQLRLCMHQSQEASEALCLVMADIDHFKKFNDNHGHLLGDQVLWLVANTLVECVKGRDIPTRFGGEEFAIILPRTNIHGAKQVGQEIRTRVASKKVIRKATGEDLGGITVSLGIAQYHPGETPESLIQRADNALYRAKSQGRNQVVTEAFPDSAVAMQG